MRRLLALVGAIVLVAVAFGVRGSVAGDDGDDDGVASGPVPADELTVLCPTQLERACRAAYGDRARVEEAGATLDRILAGESPGADAWLVPTAVGDVAAGDPAAGGLGEAVPVGARSPVVLAVLEARVDALERACGGDVTLRCLGEVAGRPYAELGSPEVPGRVQVGHGGPATATGMVVVAAAASDWHGGDAYASNDFSLEFRTWLGDLERHVGAGDPFAEMVTQGPGRYSVVVGLEADLAGRAAANTRSPVRLSTGPTVYTADLVMLPLHAGVDVASAAADPVLLDALTEAGWRSAGRTPPVTIDASLTEGNGLATKPGVLAALRDLTLEVSR